MMSAISTDDAVLIIRRSLQREIGLLERKKRLTQKEIEEFERKYGRTSAEFISEFEQGNLGDSQDCFEWWGLLQGMSAINEEIKKAEAVRDKNGYCKGRSLGNKDTGCWMHSGAIPAPRKCAGASSLRAANI